MFKTHDRKKRYSRLEVKRAIADRRHELYDISHLNKLITAIQEEESTSGKAIAIRFVVNTEKRVLFCREGRPNFRIPGHGHMADIALTAGNLFLSADGTSIIGFDNQSSCFRPDFSSLQWLAALLLNEDRLNGIAIASSLIIGERDQRGANRPRRSITKEALLAEYKGCFTEVEQTGLKKANESLAGPIVIEKKPDTTELELEMSGVQKRDAVLKEGSMVPAALCFASDDDSDDAAGPSDSKPGVKAAASSAKFGEAPALRTTGWQGREAATSYSQAGTGAQAMGFLGRCAEVQAAASSAAVGGRRLVPVPVHTDGNTTRGLGGFASESSVVSSSASGAPAAPRRPQVALSSRLFAPAAAANAQVALGPAKVSRATALPGMLFASSAAFPERTAAGSPSKRAPEGDGSPSKRVTR